MSKILDYPLLTNHGNALLLIANNQRIRIREIAASLEVSERTAQGIVADLVENEYLVRRHEGRRNVYEMKANRLLGLPMGQDVKVESFFESLSGVEGNSSDTHSDLTFDQSGIATIVIGLDGTLQHVNRAACQLFGQPASAILGHQWTDYTHPGDVEKWQVVIGQVVAGEDGFVDQQRFVRFDGTFVWTSAYVSIVRGDDGEPLHYVAQMPDLTDQKKIDEQRDFQGLHDPLTGVANRTLLISRLENGLSRTRRQGTSLGVVALNLDHFKLINSSLGHDFGDELLRQVAQRLIAVIRPADSLARVGADEFIIVSDDCTGSETGTLARLVLESIREPFQLMGHQLLVTASLGVNMATNESTATGLLRDAEVAVSRGKEQDGNRIEYFDESLRWKSERRAVLMVGLRRALERGELTVYYQPIVDLSTGFMASAEALLRWNHPELGPVTPAEFIPCAEEMGLIDEIGAWVVEQACTQLAQWHAGGHDVTVAVNVSVLQMMAADIVQVTQKTLERTKFSGAGLCFELTESVLMDDVNYFGRTFAELKALGVRLSIDDFGTGFSSLGRLKSYPIDELKVDQGFVKGLGTDASDTALVEAIVAMAHALKLSVTAEGIENESQLAQLRALGCQRGQGYFLARPMTAAAINQLIESRQRWEMV
ncbi:MAG TPA: EAL domain-containing protein [Acidimicrobiales bacterium]|nr:EAL domain-containing protein [Acidimicrobiales bacterium]